MVHSVLYGSKERGSFTLVWLMLFIVLFTRCSSGVSEEVCEECNYIEEAFGIIQTEVLNPTHLNLDSLKADLTSRIDTTTTRDSIHIWLHAALQRIHPHSSLIGPAQFTRIIEDPATPEIWGMKLADGRAYVYVGPCAAIDSTNANLYTDSLQKIVVQLYRSDPISWVLDLRENTGGNMYAMIAGLGPFFGEGPLGFDMGKIKEPWYYKQRDTEGKWEYITLSDSIYEFENKLPLECLVSESTGSAGEALAISLLTYPNMRLTGTPTYGFTSGNEMFFLSDSACLNLTTSIMADYRSKPYPNGLRDDVLGWE
ncbi:MAG: hypothetical protein KDC12_04935 [Flavobacteriales bacterium]|nr:hypothetical protein [Flavobacteriales bacterium]